MLKHLRLSVALITIVLTIGATTIFAPSYAAGPDCEVKDKDGNCQIIVGDSEEIPGDPGDPSDPGGSDSTKDRECKNPVSGAKIPCVTDAGVWLDSHKCYAQLMAPQPGPADPAWAGNHPDGAVYKCSGPTVYLIFIWMANPPAGTPGGPTPLEIAEMAIARMHFSAGDIGIVPKPGPGKMGLVGMPTWMWISNPGSSTTGPITTSASAGGITVSATAELDRIEWDMGEGTTVTCAGTQAKGTPYSDSYGRQDSPTCGHRYSKTSGEQPNNAFTVTSNAYWVVNWSGGGQSGTINLDPLTRSVSIRVGEMQVLQQR